MYKTAFKLSVFDNFYISKHLGKYLLRLDKDTKF